MSVSVEGLSDAVTSVSTDSAVVTVDITLSTVTPSVGSVFGGTLLTVAGFGFVPGAMEVNIDDLYECKVVTVTSNTITCRSPPHAAGAVNVVVTGGSGKKTLGFVYSDDKSPTITAVT